MKLKFKVLTIFLAGIVCFSSTNFTSLAATAAGDSADKTENAAAQSTDADGTEANGTATDGTETDGTEADGTSSDGTEADGDGAADEVLDPTELPIDSNEISGWPQGPAISAESAILMDADTGTVLYSKNADTAQYPASITKIMTVLLALENCSLDETVVFSQNAVFSIERGSSHIARTTDEELTMEQCLYAIMLESANECANAVAEHIAGSTEAFADMMNQRAAELGCTNTHFVNPHGLHDENHYTTAHDMALITQAALKLDSFREIASTVRYTIPPTNKNDSELIMNNHHSMMSTSRTDDYYDETVFAGKTGYTTDALNTLVTCANRNGMDLICVLMRGTSGTPYPDTASLLDYGEANFSKAALPSTAAELPEDLLTQISSSVAGFQPDQTFLTEDTPDSVILPTNVMFEALTSSISVTAIDDTQALATVSYSYEDVPVGSVSFQLTLSSVSAAADAAVIPAADSSDESKSSEPSGALLRYILIGVFGLILLLLAVVLFLMLRSHRENERRRRRRAARRRQESRRSKPPRNLHPESSDPLSDSWDWADSDEDAADVFDYDFDKSSLSSSSFDDPMDYDTFYFE